MPVRRIPKNYIHVTGTFSSQKNDAEVGNGFESLLEKDYMLLLEFDEGVREFEEQPVTIPLPRVPKGYTPDVLVHWYPNAATGDTPLPHLTEVKHTSDLKKHEEKYAPKFAAAEIYAQRRGWEFHIVTEKKIRVPRLDNLKFLREYRNIAPTEEDCAAVIDAARHLDDAFTSESLLDQLAENEDDRLVWLPIMWHLVLKKSLLTNLDVAFGGDVPLRLPISRQ